MTIWPSLLGPCFLYGQILRCQGIVLSFRILPPTRWCLQLLYLRATSHHLTQEHKVKLSLSRVCLQDGRKCRKLLKKFKTQSCGNPELFDDRGCRVFEPEIGEIFRYSKHFLVASVTDGEGFVFLCPPCRFTWQCVKIYPRDGLFFYYGQTSNHYPKFTFHAAPLV